MRSKLTLLTTAAVLAFGLTATAALAEDAPGAKGDAPGAKSDITIGSDGKMMIWLMDSSGEEE